MCFIRTIPKNVKKKVNIQESNDSDVLYWEIASNTLQQLDYFYQVAFEPQINEFDENTWKLCSLENQ